MRGFLSALASQILLLTLTSSGQTAPLASSDKNAKQPEPCRVSGQVVGAADGASLKSARVALIQEDERSDPLVFGATSDGDGHFDIKNVAPGRYNFFASHTGFISQRYKGKDASNGATLTLVSGQEVSDVVFRLIRGAAVTGRIVDESGEPMGDVMVTALRKPSADERDEWVSTTRKEPMVPASGAKTDDRGEYRLYGLKPGDYYIKAAESPDGALYGPGNVVREGESLDWTAQRELGNQYAPLYYPGVLEVDQAQALTLRGGEEVAADLTMRHVKTVQVSGSVVGADGKPATDVYVNMGMPQLAEWSEDLSASTDEKGQFHIKGVHAGSYMIEAQQRQADKQYIITRQKLEVAEENIDSVVLAFGTGVNIAGHITMAEGKAPAFDHMQVMLEPSTDDDSDGFGWAEIKKDGSFEIMNVADGSYVVRVYARGPSSYVKSARLGADDVLEKGLQVEKGSSSGTLSIVLSSATAQLEGVVTEKDKPVAGAMVRAKPDPETPYNRILAKSADTDQNGHFRITDLAPRKYRVVAKETSAAQDAPSVASKPKVVELIEHDHQNVELAMPNADTQDSAPH